MLREFAFSPDILLASTYGVRGADGVFLPSEDHGHLALNTLRKGLERAGVVRDLAGGEWLRTVTNTSEGLHPRSREVLTKLQRTGRVVAAPRRLAVQPDQEMAWLNEAVASHLAEPELSQFFGTDAFGTTVSAGDYQNLPKAISKLPFYEPFGGGGCSVKVKRTLAAYLQVLRPVIKHSRSLMFIDPYLDLGAANYRDFLGLLREIGRVRPDARVELHRQIRVTGPGGQLVPAEEWRRRFRQVIDNDAMLRGLDIEIFVWDEFHDRYLISNLMGISVPYGFDTSAREDETGGHS
ncbi:hypothetical protein HK414_23205 [Ramlibacter terrae]|uniref:Uncharacterized protein n=1 Tax=Ramlibacter terrae TaxID=2732511 RepID=A0ABX6P577_9BURK|nr:hypothetical protein HK414_23205 [Ramlibacter terrae]